MPNTHETLTSLFSDIADSIRAKTGKSATIVADNFPEEIDSIVLGSGNAQPGDVLLGKTFSNDSGAATGTMPNNGAVTATISSQGGQYTVPAGYHNGSGKVTATLDNATITSGAGTANISDPVYSPTNNNFTLTASGAVAAPTVNSPGYISSTAGTKNTNTVSGSKTLDKVETGVDITGVTTKTPVLARTAKPAGDTWTDAASGAATTAKPSSGPYVQIDAAANTGTLTATPKVTTAGYGTTSYFGSTAGTATVGAAKATTAYVPISTGSATTPATTKQQSTPSISVDSSGLITATVASTSVDVTPTVSAGWVSSGTAGTITLSASEGTSQLTTKAAETYTPGTSDQTIAAGQYLTGVQTILGDADLVADNIKVGTDIFGVSGTFTSDADAVAADISSGKTAYVNGVKVTGTGSMASGDATVVDYNADAARSAAAYLAGKATCEIRSGSSNYLLTSTGSVETVSGKLVLTLADAC